ncbi:MAG: hypothetical protein Q8L14_30315 [Myxococcales bacterium]|nr:hypothetical protein [Myxococcales bacterium]
MFGVLVVATLTAAQPIQLASMGFTQVKVPKALLASFEETFAARLSESGALRVTTQRDIITALGVERQRQLVGCAEESSSCLAELAGALGAEGFVTGDVSQVGRVLQLNVKIISPAGKTLYSALRRVATAEAMLLELDAVAADAVPKLTSVLRPVVPVEAPRAVEVVAPVAKGPRRPNVGAWVVVGVGGALVIAGAVAQGLAVSRFNMLDDLSTPVPSAVALRDQGKVEQTFGLSLLGGGAACLVAGVVWAVLGGSDEVVPSAWLTTGAQGFAVSGRW